MERGGLSKNRATDEPFEHLAKRRTRIVCDVDRRLVQRRTRAKSIESLLQRFRVLFVAYPEAPFVVETEADAERRRHLAPSMAVVHCEVVCVNLAYTTCDEREISTTAFDEPYAVADVHISFFGFGNVLPV